MSQDLHDALCREFAKIGKALGNSHRIALLYHLGQAERSVDILARTVGLSLANTSQHLQVLRRAGLVDARKAGQHVYYRLNHDRGTIRLLDSLQDLASRVLPNVNALNAVHAPDSDSVESVSFIELLSKLEAGSVTVMDVRPPEEYVSGHLPGAVSVPLVELDEHLRRLPEANEVVTYSRGPFCLMSHAAAKRLREHKITARRLMDGFPAWKLAGLPVEQGSRIQ